MDEHEHDKSHHRGLAHDLSTLQRRAINRRTMLRWAFNSSVIGLVACESSDVLLGDDRFDGAAGSDAAGSSADGSASAGSNAAGSGGAGAGGSASASCTVIPEETAGPYPGDGSNGASGGGGPGGGPGAPMGTTTAATSGDVINALALTGIIRSDIRSSIAGATGVAEGVPLSVTLTIVDATDGCTPLAGCAVYIWHCDRAGNYSMYSADVADENYLRGVQETDDAGQVTFETIFPACYSGRWPHIHFEVYPSLDSATSYANKLATSQLALPKDVCDLVFAETGYEQSINNLAQLTLETDNIFSDGYASQLAAVSGSVSAGYTTSLSVGIQPG